MSDTPSQSPLPPPEPLPQTHSSQPSYSLVELLSKNIITAISLTVTANRWRVVVVDQPSLKIISNALKMHAILEQNVMAVQLITRSRQPYHDLDAIYVLVPCADSVLRMIDDFTPDSYQQEDYQPKYAHAHLYFTGELPEDLFSQLISSPAAPYIRNISELFVEYNPFESRVFLTTPSEQPFYSLYSPHAKGATTKDLDAASDRLLSVIATLGIHPYIRYYSPKETQKDSGNGDSKSNIPRISEAMAHRLQIKLDSYYSHESSTNGGDSTSPRPQQDHGPPSVVLVLDRSIDLYAPLVHELTYQAMVYDLVNLEDGNKYVYTTKTNDGQLSQVEAELSEKADPLWEKLRHEHVGSVARILAERLERLIEGSTGIKALNSGNKKLSIDEMKSVLAELPEFKKMQASYSLHSDLVSNCLDSAERRNLPAVIDFEQELVTQMSTGSGSPVGRMSIETRLIALLDDTELENTDRIRLLLLYLVYVDGGSAPDRRRLQEVPKCLTLNDKRAAINLRRFGIPTEREQHEAGRPPRIERYKWNTLSDSTSGAQEPWFVPAVKSVIMGHLSNELDNDMFPWTQEIEPEKIPKYMFNTNATSLRRNRGNWEQKRERKKSVFEQKGTLIIYIAGGVTFSEMRSVYEMARKYKRQIYIGSTHIITPRGFLDDLKSLHLRMLT